MNEVIPERDDTLKYSSTFLRADTAVGVSTHVTESLLVQWNPVNRELLKASHDGNSDENATKQIKQFNE